MVILREAETGKKTIAELSRAHGISEPTFPWAPPSVQHVARSVSHCVDAVGRTVTKYPSQSSVVMSMMTTSTFKPDKQDSLELAAYRFE